MTEPSMDSFQQKLLASLILLAFTAVAAAQEKTHDAASATEARTTLTGKERLGRKWTDEQRIDNCNVPIDKRGTRPRPSECARASGS
jgi:hypothetical protein